MAVTAKRRADHYLPAALIGGFGVHDTRKGKTGLRFSKVAVREHGYPERIRHTRAEKVAKTIGEYWVAHPPPGLSPNFIDGYWDQYEPELPGAIRRLEDRTWTERDWEAVRKHLVAEAVRNPDFERVAIDYRAAKNDPIAHRDEVQYERLVTLANTPTLLARARLALLRPLRMGTDSSSTTRGTRRSQIRSTARRACCSRCRERSRCSAFPK